jgi:hypothetical protein
MLRRINGSTRALAALICVLATFACGAGAAMALSVSRGESYWLVSSSGQVFAYGKARNYGSEAGKHFRGQMVGIVSTPNGKGYWLVSSIGKRFGFGDAHLYKYKSTKLQKLTGHVAVKKLRGRIVGVAIAKLAVATPATVTTTATNTTPSTNTPTGVLVTITTPTTTAPTSTVPAPPVPVATGTPRISATGTGAGDILTASTDTWSNSPTSYTYVWEDCDRSGSQCTPISGATSQTYTLTSGDVGFTIVLEETATNSGGASAPDYSTPTAVVTAATGPVSPTITTATVPYPIATEPYSTTLTASGGVAPYTWALANGSTLPSGLTLTSGGTLSGTATAPGTYTFTITVTGTDRGSANVTYLIMVGTSSYNWSGYVYETTGAYTSASGTFTVPALNSSDPSDSALAEWVGVDGWDDSDLIQAGVEEQPGSAPYSWWEILPAPETEIDDLTIAAGNTVTVDLAQAQPVADCSVVDGEGDTVTGSEWNITLKNDSTNQSFSTQQCFGGASSSAEWIVEAPEEQVVQHHQTIDEIVPLADFSPNIAFTDLGTSTASATLGYTTIWQETNTPVDCNNGTGPCTPPTNPTQQATPSALDGNGFTVASSATMPAAP